MKKAEFIKELRSLLKEELKSSSTTHLKWMRSSDVREMLNISDSTLQTLRINGTIPAYKLGNTWMYKLSEIEAVLEANCTNRKEVHNG